MDDYIVANGELYHYGVLGMKWGVRKGNYSKAFAKASKKRKKLADKAVRAEIGSAKLERMALRREARAFTDRQYKRARKTQYNANKYRLKAGRLAKRGQKWQKQMEKVFKDVKVSDISKESLDAGREFVYMLSQE